MKRYLFPILITLLTLVIILKYVPLERFPEIPKQIELSGIIVAFGFYLLSYVLIAIRWRMLFLEGAGGAFHASPFLLMLISGAHQFYGNFLPARTGDLTIMYLARKHLKLEVSLGMSSLIIARAFDFVALGALALVFIFWQGHNPRIMRPGTLTFAGLFISLPLLGILSAILWGERISRWLTDHILPHVTRRGNALLIKITGFISRTTLLLSARRSISFYSRCFLLSILLMLLRVSIFSTFAIKSASPVPLVPAVIIGLSTLIASTIPIQGFLGLGAFEGGWVLGCVLVGLSPEDGLIVGMSVHLIIVIFLVFLGALCNLLLLVRKD